MTNDINNNCIHLQEFMTAQQEIMQKHIDAHKWLRGIPNEHEAIIDFANDYAWLMREMFCRYGCPDKDKCVISMELKKEKP